MDLLDQEIQKTIKYGSQFGVVYSVEELGKRLIGNSIWPKDRLNKRLKSIMGKRKVSKPSRYFEAKMDYVGKFAKSIEKYFPDILLMTVTGSVAAGYCKEEDDIDLMIITKRNRLWLNRLLLRMYVYLRNIPHRKIGQEEKANDLCFNLWIEEGDLKLPRNKQTLRNAMDTILMIPVINKIQIYEHFIAKNDWVKKFVAIGYSSKIPNFNYQISKKKVNLFLDFVNWLVFWPQWWYMKGKISTELVSLKKAFFHPSDRIRYVSEDIC